MITHALDWVVKQGHHCDALCCLYATAPFVQPEDLRLSKQRLEDSRPGTVVFAATSFPFPIQRAIHLDEQGYSAMFQPECFSTRSQDLVEAYHDAGQFYWATPQTWSEVTNLFEGMRPLLLPRWRVRDIDTELAERRTAASAFVAAWVDSGLMRVLFRADASAGIGSGHWIRCRSLARSLRSEGADVRFCGRAPAGVFRESLAREFRLIALPSASDDSIDPSKGCWIDVTEQEDARLTFSAWADGEWRPVGSLIITVSLLLASVPA